MRVDNDSSIRHQVLLLGALYSTKYRGLKHMEKKQLTIYYHYTQSNKEVPLIRLQGQWLREFGFNIGEKIEVTLEENKLVINKCAKQQ